MNLHPLIESSDLLRSLSGPDLEFFASIAREVQVAGGEVLFEEGATADEFFVISEGKIGLEMTSPGTTPMVIQTLGRGDLLGVSWFFPPHRWNWRARALTATTLVRFDAAKVRQQCEVDRELALQMLGIMAREAVGRLHRTRLQLLDLYRKG